MSFKTWSKGVGTLKQIHDEDGDFRIVALLPEYKGTYQYRVESTNDDHNRVVVESEIAPRNDREGRVRP